MWNRSGLVLALSASLAGCASGAGGGGADASVGAHGCTMEGKAVSCTLALWFATSGGGTLRERCVSACSLNYHGDVDGFGLCGDGADCGYCAFVSLTEICADCGALPDEPLDEVYCDGDPCTADQCGWDHCTHEPLLWIGEPCVRTNDFGTCEATRVCDATLCGAAAGRQCSGAEDATCASRTPAWEAPDGEDNDCDGQTDEDPGPVFPLTVDARAAHVAVAGLAGGGLVVAWTDETPPTGAALRARVATPTDPLGGAPIDVAVVKLDQAHPVVAGLAAGGFAVAWLSGADGGSTGHVRTFDAAGAPAAGGTVAYGGPEGLKVSGHDAVAADGGFVIAWSAYQPSVKVGGGKVLLERFAADGASLGAQTVADSSGEVAIAALADGSLAVVWMQGSAAGTTIFLRRYAAGEAQGDVVTVLEPPETPGQSQEAFDAVGLADGGLLLAWSSQSTGARVLAVDAGGTPRGPSTVVGTGARVLGGLAPTADGAVVVWERFVEANAWHGEILASAVSSNGEVTPEPVSLSPACTTCIAPAVARLADGRPLAVWARRDTPSSYGGPANLRGRIVEQ